MRSRQGRAAALVRKGAGKKQWRSPPPPPVVLIPTCHATTSPHPHPQRGELGQLFLFCFYNPQTLNALTQLPSF